MPHTLLSRSVIAAALAGLFAAPALAVSDIVISQVYGGGGNSGATLTHDFIELFNRGNQAVSLNGWSVQYASSTGTTWSTAALPNIALQPGQFLLIQQAKGSGGTTPLPAPDASGTLAMSATAGKVALVNSTAALSGAMPTNFVDLIGYGAANHAEGVAAPALSNTTAALRKNVCLDTDDNAADFEVGVPNPRNSAAPIVDCSAAGGRGSGGGAALPTPIFSIQGSGATSPLVGQNVTTVGVVTRVNNNGFFMQDETGDGNDETSDGIFVYTGSAPSVAIGDRVRVAGKVTEYTVGTGAGSQANPLTELTAPTVSKLASGIAITPKDIVFPEMTEGDLEKVEGMLVRIVGPLTVAQNYFLGRFGQLTLSACGRLEKPTNRHPAGSAEALALADLNARCRILLDDGTSQQNPNPTPWLGAEDTVRAGDTVSEIVGVIDYGLATSDTAGLSDYRIHPTVPLAFARDNPRAPAPGAVGGNVRVASFNVLNYFTTIDQAGAACFPSGTRSDCRGADSAAEFMRQKTKIVAALAALDADVVGLMEMENNGNTAVNDLVAGLNAVVGAGAYASVALPLGGTGGDAIRVALIYKPAKLTPVGPAVSDTNPIHNRPPLAQTFAAANGEKFTVVVNHFKSKGSCPAATDPNADQGDGQGCWNARRVEQAQALRSFIAGLQANSGDGDVLVIGDLNAYGKEDPILDFTSHGYIDQIARFEGFGYSYVFDGESGYLDHALATPSLSAQVAGVAHWHINADEPFVIDYNLEYKQPACASCGPDYYTPTPYRSSDHDPVIVGLSLVRKIVGTVGRDVLTGTPGDDWIHGGLGADTLTGGAGRDVFAYGSLRDAGDVITDFTPGEDRLDLSALLQSLGIAGGAPLAQGFVSCRDAGGDAQVMIDTDGAAGPLVARPLVTLRGRSCGALGAEDFRL